jgi:hypothetical membrane protein
MKPMAKIKTFTDRYPLIGPAIWILNAQYFIIQVVVARAWAISYSLGHNTISDLGNSACAVYGGRYVCSPLHGLMNASFIMLGLTIALGSMFIYQEFKKDLATLVGFSLMAAGGIGTVLVGLFPENTVSALHILGAGLPFVLGNVALVIFSFALPIPKLYRYYTLLSGVITLIALILLLSGHYLGLGIGGIERVVAYPQTVWLIIFGVYISSSHLTRRTKT